VYSRGINIGANAITQDFARESRLQFEEAERLTIEQGFVSLGGAYEEPDNPRQAAISKIARQVMTRLHIQVNQTIQFYRSQQGGSPPSVFSPVAPRSAYLASSLPKLNVGGLLQPSGISRLTPQLASKNWPRWPRLGEVVRLGLCPTVARSD
jgi:hypothetical protein